MATTTEPANIGQIQIDIENATKQFLSGGIAGTHITRKIEWVDTDASGHQHNSVIMRFVEAAEAELFQSLGLYSYFGIAPRVRHEVDFRAKLYFGQEVTTALIVERLGHKSMSFAFVVWGHANAGHAAVLAAEGKVTVACVQPGDRTASPWPDHVRETVNSAKE